MTDLSAPSPASEIPRSREGKRLSIIAPCFNEQEVLDLFFDRLEAALGACGVDYEIVCVNDGSRDHTLAVLENYRSGLLWSLFMGAPEIQRGLAVLGFESPVVQPRAACG